MNPSIHTWLSRAIVCIAVLSALLLAHRSQDVGMGTDSRPERIAGKSVASPDRMLARDQAGAEQ
jgi:hypothetical protein